MESKFNYSLTDLAETDLNSIVSYISFTLLNPNAAANFLNKFVSVIEEIKLFPQSGAIVENEMLPNIEVRQKNVGNYILFYTIDYDESVFYVLSVIFSKRDMNEVFNKIGL